MVAFVYGTLLALGIAALVEAQIVVPSGTTVNETIVFTGSGIAEATGVSSGPITITVAPTPSVASGNDVGILTATAGSGDDVIFTTVTSNIPTISAAPSSSSEEQTGAVGGSSGSSSATGAIVGGVIAGLAVLGLASFVILRYRNKRSREHWRNQNEGQWRAEAAEQKETGMVEKPRVYVGRPELPDA